MWHTFFLLVSHLPAQCLPVALPGPSPTPMLAASPTALVYYPSLWTAMSVYVSTTPIGLGVPGTLPA
jgi:hypothetical protein